MRRRVLLGAGTLGLAATAGCGSNLLNSANDSGPQFKWEYTPVVEGEYGTVTITHDGGGRSVQADQLIVRGAGIYLKSVDGDIIDVSDKNTTTVFWEDQGEVTGKQGDEPAVQSGDSVRITVTSEYRLYLIQAPPEGQNKTFRKETGPDAPSSNTNRNIEQSYVNRHSQMFGG